MDKNYVLSKDEIIALTKTVYEDDSLRVSHTFIDGATETIIMFPFARIHLGSTESIGFYRLADKNVIYIVDKNNSWFNDFTPETVLSIIDDIIKDQEITLVGISMGAFNAIYFSNFIKHKRCIAIAPQTSIAPRINHRSLDINAAVQDLIRRKPGYLVRTVLPSRESEIIIFWGDNAIERVHSHPMIKKCFNNKIKINAVIFKGIKHDVVGGISKRDNHKRHIIYEKLINESLEDILSHYKKDRSATIYKT